jgi:hypothetical protein
MSTEIVLTDVQTQRLAAGGSITIEFVNGATLIVHGALYHEAAPLQDSIPRARGATMPAPPNKIVRR